MKAASYCLIAILSFCAINVYAQNVPFIEGLKDCKQITINAKPNLNNIKLGLADESGEYTEEITFDGSRFSIAYPARGAKGGYFDDNDYLNFNFPGIGTKMPIGARLLVSYYDFDSDYIHEVIIALKNKDNYFINVFRKQESKTTWGWAGDIVLEGCFNKPVFNNGELTIPIGSQGLFTTYTYYYGALVEDGSGLQTLISKLVETASSKASNRHPSSAIISIKLLNREKHESPEVITLQDKYSIVMKGKILGVNLYDVVVTTQGKLVKVGGDVIITNAVVLSDTKN